MRRSTSTATPRAPAAFFTRNERAHGCRSAGALLLRGDFKATERALVELQKQELQVAVSLEGNRPAPDRGATAAIAQRPHAFANRAQPPMPASQRRRKRGFSSVHGATRSLLFRRLIRCTIRTGFFASVSERRGIFVGTREWNVPSRNHAAALWSRATAKRPANRSLFSTESGVAQVAGRTGLRKESCACSRNGTVRGLPARSGATQDCLPTRPSRVPGQVAGDAFSAACHAWAVMAQSSASRFRKPAAKDARLGELARAGRGLLRDNELHRATLSLIAMARHGTVLVSTR